MKGKLSDTHQKYQILNQYLPVCNTKNLFWVLTKIIATWENLSYVWHMYESPNSSKRIFCRIKVATCNEEKRKKDLNSNE